MIMIKGYRLDWRQDVYVDDEAQSEGDVSALKYLKDNDLWDWNRFIISVFLCFVFFFLKKKGGFLDK